MFTRTAAATLAAGVLVVVGASSSQAVGSVLHPNGCPTGVSYTTTDAGATFQDAVSAVHLGPGTTAGISIYKGNSVTTSLEGSVTFSASAIVASAQATVKAGIAYQWISGITYYMNAPTPVNYWRYLHAGSDSERYTWRQYRDNANCSETLLGSGTGTSPWHEPTTWLTNG